MGRGQSQTGIGLMLATGLLVGATTSLSGCVGSSPEAAADRLSHYPVSADDRPGSAIALLQRARELDDASPERRATAVERALERVQAHPGAESYAELALAFGRPRQTRYTPDEAGRYARLALDAEDAAWSRSARQYLSDYARLYREIGTTEQAEPPRPADAVQAPGTTRGETDAEAVARIELLEAELAEARRKLRELVDLEGRLDDSPP